MSVPLPGLSWWLLGGGKNKDSVPEGSSLNPSTEAFKFPTKLSPTKAKAKRSWVGEKKVEKHNRDGSDGICSSESETDGPEWSDGWMEPHSPEFECNDEEDGGFVVLVPCYRGAVEGSRNQILRAIKNLPNGFSPDEKNYMEQWLSSLQNL